MYVRIGLFIGVIGAVLAGLVVATPTAAQDEVYCDSAVAEAVKYNVSVTGQLDDDTTVRGYCFEGRAGDVVTLTVFATQGDLDPQVMIFDQDLVESYAYNNDISADNRNAELTYTLEADGRYTILVSRYDVSRGTTSGDFALVVRGIAAEPDTQPTVDPSASVNVCDSPLTILLEYGDSQRSLVDNLHVGAAFCFVGQADEVVTIAAEAVSGDLDTLLLLADPFYETIYAQNDDQARGESDSLIADFVLPQTGQYLIVVTRFGEAGGQTSGEFIVTLRSSGSGVSGGGVSGSGPATHAPPSCTDPFVEDLSVAVWQSLTDPDQTLQFFCDGRALWRDARGDFDATFNAQDGIVILTLLETGETYVWGDVLVVEGFFTATGLETGESVYYAAFAE